MGFIMAIRKIYFLIITYITLSHNYIKSDNWITIFVHGSIGVEIGLNPLTIFKALVDKIQNTEHARTIARIRKKLISKGYQCISELDLQKINLDNQKSLSINIFTKLYKEVSNKICPKKSDNIDEYYTFGWSGLLSNKERCRESKNLYNSLIQAVKDFYNRYKKYPKIRLIGYSHGGDTCLHLSCLQNFYNIKIDEMILVGMPVTYNTNTYIKSPIFKRIYHIYSQGDLVQKLDFFAPRTFISHRRLKKKFPRNITEVGLKIKAKLLRNTGCKTLPKPLRGTVIQSPGHIELWSFGWVKKYYRKSFVFYPLPMALFIPYIIEAAKNHIGESILLDIRPDQEKSFLITDKSCLELNFFPKNFVDYLKIEALEARKT